jgi:hypothetical protein
VREVQTVLRAHPRRLPDARALALLREIVSRPEVGEALEHGADTALAFILRAVNHAITNFSLTSVNAMAQVQSVANYLELERTLKTEERRRFRASWKRPWGR